ncbi:unnamed protein product [Protopolystoma xenopodis]|uniref:Uncharacterized protein n=1 Tax=Protopolystoma xenopodis TaxID=117903 RepID=A0A448XJM7_9PLAT|nr:unnamed protein product [Protopolystoma xenopodis]
MAAPSSTISIAADASGDLPGCISVDNVSEVNPAEVAYLSRTNLLTSEPKLPSSLRPRCHVTVCLISRRSRFRAGWTSVSTSHRSYQHPQRESNRDSAEWELDTLNTRPHCHECPWVTDVNFKEGQAFCHIILFGGIVDEAIVYLL